VNAFYTSSADFHAAIEAFPSMLNFPRTFGFGVHTFNFFEGENFSPFSASHAELVDDKVVVLVGDECGFQSQNSRRSMLA
jgi:hypothetical protein